MKTQLLLSLLVLAATAVPAAADDSKRTIRAQLSGYDEVPAVSTAGWGEFEGRLDASSLTYTLTYADLRGTTTSGAHIHLGLPGTNGGVIAHLCGGGGAPPCLPVAGTITGTIGPAQVVGPAGQGIDPGQFEELVAAIAAGATYVNVHTDLHLLGEIRGQVK
jgi:hypothetical protein